MWDHPLTPVAMLCLFLPIIHPVAFTALDVGPPTDTSGQSLHLMCDHPLTPVAMLCLFLPIIHPVASVCVCNSAKLLLKYSALYIVSQNTIPNTSSCNSSKHCPTVIKKNTTWRLGNEKVFIFPPHPTSVSTLHEEDLQRQ